MERKLEDICKGEEFVIHLHNIYYCNLKINQDNIQCNYRANEKDHNGLYRCDAAMCRYNEVIKQ